MKGNKDLFKYEDRWATGMGAWLRDEGKVLYRDKELFRDLKNLPWMGLLLYGITGRIFEKKALKLFEAIWVISVSYPDPRLWPNRIAAFAGTARSTATSGIAAAVAACEAVFFGNRANIRSIDFLLRTKQQLDRGMDLDELVRAELKKNRRIYGYGRPVKPQKDERIDPLMEVARELGFADGYFVKLAFDIEAALLRGRWRWKMNITALAAALAADQGLSPRDFIRWGSIGFTAGIIPCYIDAFEKPQGCFFPLRCTRINYEGAAPRRKWNDTGNS
ncbi:MAG: hypothetical protein GY757_47155 [bacterium]|nr:hypothetical protein [bacterium]